MWFSRERAESERFARALEPSPMRRDDEFAEELALVSALHELGAAGTPDPATRRRIRDEIEGRLETAEPLPLRRRRRHQRVADLVAAAVFVVLALTGLGLVLSRNALPGDALYGVKRAGESTSLGLTFGDQARAEKHLEFAGNRVTEVGELAAEGANAAAYRTALDDFTTDVSAGVSGLTTLATGDSGRQQLTDLRLWARDQDALLGRDAGNVPAEAAPAFGEARSLLGEVIARTSALAARLDCYQITTGSTDRLGLVPAQGVCTQKPAQQPGSGGSAPSPGAPATEPAPSATELPAVPSGSGVPPVDAHGTPITPTPNGGSAVPPVYPVPITTPSKPRTPTTTPPPPLISLPPLLPGLPPIVIG